MAVRSFYTPPVTPPGNGQRAYFEQPGPGKARLIRNVIVNNVGSLSASDMVTVEKLPDGILFAMGAGTNNPMSTGAHQLFNPVEQRSGENVWIQPPLITAQVSASPAGTGTAMTLHPSSGIPTSDLLIVAAGTLDGTTGSLPGQSFTDTESNSYTNIAAQTLGSSGGLTVAATDPATALTISDTINWNAIGVAGSPAFVAIAAAGAASGAAREAYATAAAQATTGAASVSSAGNVNSGDLAVLVAINSAVDPAPGGAWSELEIARGTASRLAIFTQNGAGAPLTAAWATSNQPWIGVITAIPNAAAQGYNGLAISLSGQEQDLRHGI